MAKEKFKMMFNATNGVMLGHLPPDQPTFGIDPDSVNIKTVEYDPTIETFLGGWEDGKVVKIKDVQSTKTFIDEEIVKEELRLTIEEEYPIHKQLNIMIDMINKSDMPNTPEFQKMMAWIKDQRDRTKAKLDSYKANPDAYDVQTKEMSELSRKLRMGEE